MATTKARLCRTSFCLALNVALAARTASACSFLAGERRVVADRLQVRGQFLELLAASLQGPPSSFA